MSDATKPLQPLRRENLAEQAHFAFEVSVVSGPDAGKSVVGKDKVLVGKGPAANLQLSDEAVSRLHLEVEPRADGVRVRDVAAPTAPSSPARASSSSPSTKRRT